MKWGIFHKQKRTLNLTSRRVTSAVIKSNLKPMSAILISWFLLSGHSVLVQWNKNKEKDVAGYKVYWGLESRKYITWQHAGDDTFCTIENLEPGRYFLAVTAYDSSGNESDFSKEVFFEIQAQPDSKIEYDDKTYNFPNPFNPKLEYTTIRYALSQATTVSISIYDVNDQLVRELLSPSRKSAGEHIEDLWDGRDDKGQIVPIGIYFAIIRYDFITKVVTIAVAY